MTQIDYKLSLKLIKKINTLIEESPIREFFLYEDKDLLQASQMSLFSDIKIWTMNKHVPEVDNKFSPVHFLKSTFVSGFILVISIFSILFFFLFKKKVGVFTGDKLGNKNNDYRLDSLYEALRENETSYFEIVHVVPGKEVIINFFKRKRFVIYLECLDFLSFLRVSRDKKILLKLVSKLNLEGFDEREKYLVKSLVIRYASIANIFKVRLTFLSFIFQLIQPKKLFAIDDVRHYHAIILSAGVNGVETYAIQHGHFTKYHVGWIRMTNMSSRIIKPDKMIVWSEYWKNELLRLGTYFDPEEIMVGGNKGKIDTVTSERQENDKTVVLVPYEADAPKEEVKRYIFNMVNSESTEVIFKLRMGLPKENQIEEYGLSQVIDKINLTYSIKEVFQKVNVVVGTYSTFLYDMLELGKPVGILKTSLDYGEGMIINGLANEVKETNLKADLNKLVNLSKEERNKRIEATQAKEERRLKDTLEDIVQN